MKAIRLGLIGAVLLCWLPAAPAQGQLPPAAQEVLTQFEKEAAELEKDVEAAVKRQVEKTAAELQKVQDMFCKEAKLDEAVAVRDLIRALRAGTDTAPGSDTPAAAREIYKQHEEELAEIPKKAQAEAKKRLDKAAAELQKVQDAYCKEAKLDEAVAVRDVIRLLRGGVTGALADPGYVNNAAADIGKVSYYEVTGVDAGQSIYGTDVYTTGSHLGMAAVHCGLLRPRQKGIVKVTILPGQAEYAATTRNGVTSIAYGKWDVSFKVERVYGFVGKLPASAPVDAGRR
jgi:hypothetical protein